MSKNLLAAEVENIGVYMSNRFLRIWQIIGDRERGCDPIIPVSKSAWWAGVSSGKYPAPVKLSARCTAWRSDDIDRLIQELGGAQ